LIKVPNDNYIKISKEFGVNTFDWSWSLINKFNIFFPISENSSNIINYNWSYFLTKLYNHFKLNDGKSLQLSGIERLEWIIVLLMLNVVFLVHAMGKDFFLKRVWMRMSIIKMYQSLN